MFKYVKIDAILNYISDPVKEQEDSVQLKSWANQVYKNIELPTQYEAKFALLPVKNHKAALPNDVKKIFEVRFSNESLPENITQTLDLGDNRLLVYQEILLEDVFYKSARPLRYLGQNRGALIRPDVIDRPLYCNNCSVGFSVDSQLSCMTIDIEDTTENTLVILGYFAQIKDGNDILIPDDSDLMQGLADYAMAMHWRNRSERHEQAARNYFREYMNSSNNLINRFKNKVKIRAFNTAKHENLNKSRFSYNWNYKR